MRRSRVRVVDAMFGAGPRQFTRTMRYSVPGSDSDQVTIVFFSHFTKKAKPTDMLLSHHALHRANLSSSLRLAVFVCKVRRYGTPTNTSPRHKSKVWSSADHAVQDIKSGSVLLCGGEQGLTLVKIIVSIYLKLGFGWAGIPG